MRKGREDLKNRLSEFYEGMNESKLTDLEKQSSMYAYAAGYDPEMSIKIVYEVVREIIFG